MKDAKIAVSSELTSNSWTQTITETRKDCGKSTDVETVEGHACRLLQSRGLRLLSGPVGESTWELLTVSPLLRCHVVRTSPTACPLAPLPEDLSVPTLPLPSSQAMSSYGQNAHYPVRYLWGNIFTHFQDLTMKQSWKCDANTKRFGTISEH